MKTEEERREIRRLEGKLKRGEKLRERECAIYSYSPRSLASSCRCKR